jgi:peroxiredoxin/predicted 2-oxoglutarate/Fe(II)-dependent dioxygenase YbiX
MAGYINLTPGDPAPWFKQRSTSNPSYTFASAAGRYLVLCFYASASDDATRQIVHTASRHTAVFNDTKAALFGVSLDPRDETEKRVEERMPGFRLFWDFDGAVSKLYGSIPQDAGPGPVTTRRIWVVIDPTLRVMRVIPFTTASADLQALLAYLDALPPPDRFAGFEIQAPVLILPNIFEPAFCEKLIKLYETHGGTESGFMREVDGKTVAQHDYNHKRRKDYVIDDRALMMETQARINRRVVPEVRKVHQFEVTRMERYIVSCYAAEDEAHFRAHRDNTTKGTAHRRFAVSVNLNAAFEGGEVSFPEYGPRSFKPPPGGAVVFSCSLLHAVSKVTAGRRYAFLPFLYDDAAAKIREANNAHLGDGVGAYKAST